MQFVVHSMLHTMGIAKISYSCNNKKDSVEKWRRNACPSRLAMNGKQARDIFFQFCVSTITIALGQKGSCDDSVQLIKSIKGHVRKYISMQLVPP